ncbi:MAG: nuclear transport factor 2 family protein [Candidatus Acidiferrales bacterium]
MKAAIIIALCSLFWLTIAQPNKINQQAPSTDFSSSSAVVENKIREAWQDFKAKKEGAYANLLADDFTAVEIDGEGPHDKQASVSEVRAGTLRSYSLKDFKVRALCANVALATYLAETDGTLPNGTVIHGTVTVTEVWVRRANEWKNLRYHESELK